VDADENPYRAPQADERRSPAPPSIEPPSPWLWLYLVLMVLVLLLVVAYSTLFAPDY
jgi:hypothetical protein